MGNKLIESNFNVSKIYTMRESAFDNSPFEYIPKDYSSEPEEKRQEKEQLDLLNQSGLINYEDASTLSNDVDKTIKEFINDGKLLVEAPPVPLTTNPDSFSPTLFDEKSSYLRKFINNNDVEFYPLCNNLCKVNLIKNYLNYLTHEVDESEVPISVYDDDSIQKIDGLLSRDINVSQRGASPSNSENNNLLFYPNEESCWADCWPGSVSLNNSLFISYDTFEVGVDNTESFSADLILEPDTTYCGSLFARFYDGSSNIDERIKEDTLIENILKVEIGNIEVIFLGTNDNEISTSWKRFFYVFRTPNVTGSIECSLTMSLMKSIPIPLRISGLLIEEQNYPSPYINTSISYESNSLNNNPTIYSPLAINSSLLTKDKSWTLMYKKFVEGINSNGDSFDSFSDIICGEEIKNKNKYCNKEQTIFLIHSSGFNKVEVRTYLDDNNYDSYEITCEDSFSSSETLIEGEAPIEYNILLGSTTLKCGTYHEDNKYYGYYGYYKDLLIVPEVLEDNNIKEILNTFFDVNIKYTDDNKKYKYLRDGYLIPYQSDVSDTITFENLKNLTGCDIGVKYKLEDSDSTFGYDVGDILVCISKFNRKLSDSEITSYWSRTPRIKEEITLGDATIFRAGNLIEGYIGE